MKPLTTLLVELEKKVTQEQKLLDLQSNDNRTIREAVKLLEEMFYQHASFAKGGANHGKVFPPFLNEDFSLRIGVLLGLDYKGMRDEGSL